MIFGAWPALPSTSRFFREYIARRLSRAGPRYFRGSNSSGFREGISRIFAVAMIQMKGNRDFGPNSDLPDCSGNPFIPLATLLDN